MTKPEVRVGQIWKSKYAYPEVGRYTVEILYVGKILMTRFTASAWEDGHWVENHLMTIDTLLENYEPQD